MLPGSPGVVRELQVTTPVQLHVSHRSLPIATVLPARMGRIGGASLPPVVTYHVFYQVNLSPDCSQFVVNL